MEPSPANAAATSAAPVPLAATQPVPLVLSPFSVSQAVLVASGPAPSIPAAPVPISAACTAVPALHAAPTASPSASSAIDAAFRVATTVPAASAAPGSMPSTPAPPVLVPDASTGPANLLAAPPAPSFATAASAVAPPARASPMPSVLVATTATALPLVQATPSVAFSFASTATFPARAASSAPNSVQAAATAPPPLPAALTAPFLSPLASAAPSLRPAEPAPPAFTPPTRSVTVMPFTAPSFQLPPTLPGFPFFNPFSASGPTAAISDRVTVFDSDGSSSLLTPDSSARLIAAAAANLSQTPIAWQPPPVSSASALSRLPRRVVDITSAAYRQLAVPLQPLEVQACADLLHQLRAQTLFKFGEPVADATALRALDASRRAPHSRGQPSVEGALACLQIYEGVGVDEPISHQSSFPPALPAAAPTQQPTLPRPPTTQPAPLFFRKGQNIRPSAASFSTASTLPRGAPPDSPFAPTLPVPTAPSTHGDAAPLSPVRLFGGPSSIASPNFAVSPVPPERFRSVNYRNVEPLRANSGFPPAPHRNGCLSPRSSSGSSAETFLLGSPTDRSSLSLPSELASQFLQGLFEPRQPATPPPAANNSSQHGLLFQKACRVRQLYEQAAAARQSGHRPTDDQGGDVELSAPLSIARDCDNFIQRRLLEASAFVPRDEARSGLPEEVFEQAWEEAARSLVPVVAEASGASQEEVREALSQCEADCSVALLSILNQKGDLFQQACAQASMRELQRQRQERSLEKIVQEAAQQGGVPPDLSSRKLLRMLKQHLPLTEIMGHRYRTSDDRVSFVEDSPEDQRSRSGSRASERSERRRSPPNSKRVRRRRDESDSDEDEDEEQEEDSSADYEEESSPSDDNDNSESGTTGDEDSDDLSETSEDEESSDSSNSRSRKRSHGSSRRRSRSPRQKSNLVATPPPDWVDGDPPQAGFYLETFTNVYGKFRSFTNKYKKTGLQFKSLIDGGLAPTVHMELKLTEKQYDKISDDELIRRIKSRLGFNDGDYYSRKLEVLKLPSCKYSSPLQLQRAFRKLTSPFLKILKEAKDSGVHLRYANVSRIFKNQIKGCVPLERWFMSENFKSFNAAVRHISTQIHDRIANAMEADHDEQISEGRVAGVAGARSDFRGGKSESGQALQRKAPQQSKQNQSGSRPTDNRQPSRDTSANRRPPRTEKEEAAFQAAMAKEKDLPQGMYHHPRGPFCREDPCRAKICQGCNYHADAEGRGHIRPNCRCKEHSDYVKTGYFHEAHPGRTGALALPRTTGGSADTPRRGPPPPAPTAKVRNVAGSGTKSKTESQ